MAAHSQVVKSFAELDRAFAPTPSGTSVSKRKKFGWSDPGQEPRFEWLHKDHLFIDHANYQRAYSHGRAVNIAKKMNWRRFEAIVIGRRPDGVNAVIEGQHRVEGARLRDDIDLLPCLVFDMDAIGEEARAFVEIGTGSKALTSLDKFRPAVTIGDTAAVLVNDLLTAAGYTTGDSQSAKNAKCVGVLQMLAKTDEELFTKAWPLILDVHNGQSLHNRVVQAVHYLYKFSEGRVGQNPYRKRLMARGRDQLVADAGRAAALYAAGGPKVWAAGIAAVMSRGLQDDRKIIVSLDSLPSKGSVK